MNENKMGVMPVNKLLLTMAAPMVLSMLIGALYNVVDSLFVSHCPASCVLVLINFFSIFRRLQPQYLARILNYRHLYTWQFLD